MGEDRGEDVSDGNGIILVVGKALDLLEGGASPRRDSPFYERMKWIAYES